MEEDRLDLFRAHRTPGASPNNLFWIQHSFNSGSISFPSCACSPRAFRATPRPSRHHDRALTLVFGSDGQVSLIGFDGGISSQVPHAPSASYVGVLTSATVSVPASGSPVPNLEATSSGTSSLSLTPTPPPTRTNVATSSSYDPSSIATDTDTNLPSVPTLSFPAPSPTPASHSDDHSAGAPFYLALVLASISLVGCVAAFIAWWIRSRARSPNFELNDPWHHHSTISGSGSPFAGGENAFEKGAQLHMETQTTPYYLPASLVRRTSSDLLPIPHVDSSREDDTPRNGISRMAHPLRTASFRRLHHPRDPTSEPDHSRTVPLSQMPNWRPGTERLPTGLSVQESTRTLGRLRVANRVPGDVTSGDEGGINALRPQNYDGLLPAANAGDRGTFPSEKNPTRNIEGDKSLVIDDVPLEPPGPATLPWGRRIDTIAALRRTRRRTPGADQTYQNVRDSESVHPTFDGGTGGAMSLAPPVSNQVGAEGIQEDPLHNPLGWTSTLKSSFWQAVDAMTRTRTPDPESRPENDTLVNGSRFTPAPQRVASRRSAVSPIRSVAQNLLSDTHAIEETGPQLLDNPQGAQETLQILTRPLPEPDNLSTTTEVSEAPQISRVTMGRLSSTRKMSRLSRDLGEGTHPRHPDSLRAETGSVYSTDSAAARANLRKYGYDDSVPIPSSWSALGRARESQLDLDRPFPFLPLPRPVSRSSLARPSITPSQLTFDSAILSSAASTRTRTRTPVQSLSDLSGSDANMSRSSKSAGATGHGETPYGSSYSLSGNGTVQSGHTMLSRQDSLGVPSHSLATTSSMLSRKKGVTRKRPRPPSRAPSSASSVHSVESGLSIREVAVRRALLERRRKMKAADSIKGREDASHSSGADGLPT